MTIDEYINTFENNELWFIEEVNKPYHKKRISDVVENKYYLSGKHKVMSREDAVYKGKELITRKTIIQYAKTILKFHDTYLLGKPITISGNEEVVNTFNQLYKDGNYENIDYNILDRVNKFADAYECVYAEDGRIKSRVMDSADCYPVYTDTGEYIAFIEHWTDGYSNISYWNVFYENAVEHWNNEGGTEQITQRDMNICGLPIHYHNNNDNDYLFGESILDDLKPLLDELEDVFSKLGDAIYVNTLNPLAVSTGQRIDNAIPADATGYTLNLELGSDFKMVATQMDYNNIKYYVDMLRTMIDEVAMIPAVLSNSEVSNISEMSMKMLFKLAEIRALDTEKWLTEGIQKRFEIWRKILELQGKKINDSVEISYNLTQPIDGDELVSNLKVMRSLGAMSKRTIMEQSGFIKNTDAEMKRLEDEGYIDQSTKDGVEAYARAVDSAETKGKDENNVKEKMK